MKKLLLVLVLAAVVLCSSGCAFFGEGSVRDLNYVTDRDDAFVKERMDKIVEALREQDREKGVVFFFARVNADGGVFLSAF